MELQMKWLLLLIAVLVAVPTVTAGYVQSGPDSYVSEYDPANSQTSTMEEYTDVDTDATGWASRIRSGRSSSRGSRGSTT